MSRDDADLVDLLEELEGTLTELRSELGPDPERRRPPTPGEVLRFTERYTLPTAIALLEATVQSLELLRALLRLADPERSGPSDGPADRERTPDVADLRTALSDLRTALTDPDLPADSGARDVLDEARGLTAEIERRLTEGAERAGGDGRAADRRDTRPSTEGIDIDVTEERGSGGTGGADQVDVDAELASIKESMEGNEGNGDGDGENGDGDGENGDGDEGNGDADGGSDGGGDEDGSADATGDGR